MGGWPFAYCGFVARAGEIIAALEIYEYSHARARNVSLPRASRCRCSLFAGGTLFDLKLLTHYRCAQLQGELFHSA